MMRKRILLYSAALAIAFSSALGAAPAAADTATKDSRIAIVNDSDAPMLVYAEDESGTLHELGVVRPGEVETVETPAAAEGVMVRLHARPHNSRDRLSTWGDVGITTDALDLTDHEMAIFWLARDLAESQVEVRPS
jgi:hypothetical protein